MELILEHLEAIIATVAALLAAGIAWGVKKTKTDIDDKIVKKTAEEVKKKLDE